MITNKSMVPELLATYSLLLQEEIDYLEKHGNYQASIKLLADLSSTLVKMCFKLNDVYSVIGLDDTNILINGAKDICRELSMMNATLHHNTKEIPNTYVDISNHILYILKHFEELQRESNRSLGRMAMFRR